MNKDQEKALRDALSKNPLAKMILQQMHGVTVEAATIDQLKAVNTVVKDSAELVKESEKAEREREKTERDAYTEYCNSVFTRIRNAIKEIVTETNTEGAFAGKRFVDVAAHNTMSTTRLIIETLDKDKNPLPKPVFALAGVFNNGVDKKPFYVDASGITREERTRAVRKNVKQTKKTTSDDSGDDSGDDHGDQ